MLLSLVTLAAAMASPPPVTPTLAVGVLFPNTPLQVDVDGVPPGGLVAIFASTAGPGAGPCHPTRPVCAGMLQPILLAAGRADAAGALHLSVNTPGSLPPHAWFQAITYGRPGDGASLLVERLSADPDGFPRISAQWLWDDGAASAVELARYRYLLDGGVLDAAAGRAGTSAAAVHDRIAAMHTGTVLLGTGLGPDYNPAYGPIADPYSAPEHFMGSAAGDLWTHWSNPTLYGLNVSRAATRALAIADNLDRDAALGTRSLFDRRYDGLFVDSMEPWGEYFCCGSGTVDRVDLDRDGVDDDPDTWRRAWSLGIATYGRELSAALGSDTAFVVNGSGERGGRAWVWHHADAAIDEHGLNEVFALPGSGPAWTMLVQRLAARGDVLGDPHGVLVAMEATGGSGPADEVTQDPALHEAARTDWRRMRFGLGSALLAGQTYFYDWGASAHGFPWWYDEYGGRTGLPLGWLGAPVDDAAPVSLPTTSAWSLTDADLAQPSAWGNWCLGGAPPISVTDTDATTGPTSVRFDVSHPPAGDDGWVASCNASTLGRFPVTAGEHLTVSFDARGVATDGGEVAAGRFVEPQIQAELGGTWTLLGDGGTVMVTDRWRHYVAEIVVDTTTTQARLDFGLTNADGSVWVDGITLTRGAPSPVWRRDYARGVVWVNGSDTDVTVSAPAGLRRLSGTQDAAVNSGAAVGSTVVVPAWDAVLLRR